MPPSGLEVTGRHGVAGLWWLVEGPLVLCLWGMNLKLVMHSLAQKSLIDDELV